MIALNYKVKFALTVNGFHLTHPNYFGNDRNIPIFETKEDAQMEIDRYYGKANPLVKISKIKVIVF